MHFTKHIRTSLAPFAFIFCLSSLLAHQNGNQWSITTGVFPKYLGTIGGVFYDSPILVTDLTTSRGEYYAGIWNSTGLGAGKYGKTFGDEYDFYVGWAHDAGKLKYEVTAMYFLIADLNRIDDDLWVIDQKVSFPTGLGFQPYFKLRCFGSVGANSPGGGLFAWIGVSRVQPLGFDVRGQEVKLDIDLTAAFSDGPLGKTPGPVFGRLTVVAPLPLSPKITLKPSIVWQTPIGGQQDFTSPLTTRTELVWGLSLGAVF